MRYESKRERESVRLSAVPIPLAALFICSCFAIIIAVENSVFYLHVRDPAVFAVYTSSTSWVYDEYGSSSTTAVAVDYWCTAAVFSTAVVHTGVGCRYWCPRI